MPGDSVHQAHARLAADGLNGFILSTCLRVEIVVAGDEDTVRSALASIYGSSPGIGTIRRGEKAFHHLCRIAAGFASPVLGEPEVFVQFRQAVQLFGEEASAPWRLGRALERVVGVARAIRRHFPEPAAGSLGTLAARRAAGSPRVAVLGSGSMARAVVAALPETEITVFSRRPIVVEGRPTAPWSKLPDALSSFPAVISAIPGGTDPHFGETLGQIIERRPDPLLLVDLGMPPAFPGLPATGAVRYLGVDDLAGDGNLPDPELAQALGWAAEKAWQHLATDDQVGSVIAGLTDMADMAVSEEVRRFVNRVAAAEDPEPLLAQLAHTVARRILHSPISYVRSSRRADAMDVLAEAFGVEI